MIRSLPGGDTGVPRGQGDVSPVVVSGRANAANRWIVLALVALSVVGVGALAALVINGAEPRWRWGYLAATVSVLMSAGQTAPVLSFASRLGRGYWGARLRRVADLLALTGLITAPTAILLLSQLPDWRGRPSIWSDWPWAPQLWDAIAILTLTVAGLALTWLVTWPERRGLGWAGTPTQWQVLTRAVIAIGALYTFGVVFVHLLVASDLALSLVPGWHSAVIPAYLVVSAFESAVAAVTLMMALLGALTPRLSRSCAKLLLSMSLLWFYLVWCELLTNWYGRTPDEQSVLALFMFGPGGPLFALSTLMEFLVPVVVLMGNSARSSPRTTAAVAGIVLFGCYVDRLRLFVGAWSVVSPPATEHLPDTLQPLSLPGLAEALACVGMLAVTGLVLVVAFRRFAPSADWEVKAVERLTPERRVLRTRTVIVARPG